jgi:urease accessory protein
MNTEAFLRMLQFTDGLFPIGAHAHSFGLETCVQSGVVRDATGVENFLRVFLERSAAPTDAVLTLCARTAAIDGDLASCIRIDHKVHATKPAAELREASRQMGKQALRIFADLHEHPLVQEFSAAVANGTAHGHHPVAYGIAAGVLGWPPEELAAAYLYANCALLVNASLRLMPLGQLAGQRILWNIQPLIAKLSLEIQSVREEDIWTFAPLLEIASMRHESLEARLARS